MKNIKLINQYQKNGQYHSKRWSLEKATKYIFGCEDFIIEAGFYSHFSNSEMMVPVKCVIELSTSYGCPFHCRYCASSSIKNVSYLSAAVIFEVFSYIYNDQKMDKFDCIEVSFMGIGDIYYTSKEVLSAIPLILETDKRIRFNISSCCWTVLMLEEFEQYVNNIKTLQLTFISSSGEYIRSIIPGMPQCGYDLESTIRTLFESKFSRFRINYIMIKGINDSESAFLQFVDLVEDYKEKMVVRISKMNTTKASRSNGLISPNLKNMKELHRILDNEGIESYLFYSEQDDNMNCGQLITEC